MTSTLSSEFAAIRVRGTNQIETLKLFLYRNLFGGSTVRQTTNLSMTEIVLCAGKPSAPPRRFIVYYLNNKRCYLFLSSDPFSVHIGSISGSMALATLIASGTSWRVKTAGTSRCKQCAYPTWISSTRWLPP